MATIWGSGDYYVLGATLLKPAPLARTKLPIDTGLTVLYGRNGAGKTRALEALQATITGIQGRSWAWLHIRLRRDATPDHGGLIHAVTNMLAERHDPDYVYDFDDVSNEVSFDRASKAIADRLGRLWEETVAHAWELAAEVAGAAVLTLLPVGEANNRRWRVFASALPSDDTPLLSARAAVYQRAWAQALRQPTAEASYEAILHAQEEFGLEDEMAELDDPVPFSVPGEPMLLLELGVLNLPRPLCDLYGDASVDIQATTLEKLTRVDGKRRALLRAGTDQLAPEVVEDLRYLSSRASELYAGVLERAPRLTCVVAPVEDWPTRPAVTWMADDAKAPGPLPLEELSQAQHRWAKIAIAATLSEYDAAGGRAVMLLDEPEQALHAQAIRTMASGLQAFTSSINVDVLVTTHAGALLEEQGTNLLHVRRAGGGGTRIDRLAEDGQGIYSTLGLRKSEVLQLTRRFVVVEGLHDELVLRTLFPEELSKARAHLLPMRGARNAASLMDAKFLLDFSDADFLVVLDAVPRDKVDAAWERARAVWRATQQPDAVAAELKTLLPGAVRNENRFLRELMLSALVANEDSRLTFGSLPQPDVIYYLPVAALTDRPTGWPDLEDEWRRSGTRQSFKDWLKSAYGFSFEPDNIVDAARALDELHPDLVVLAQQLLNAESGNVDPPDETGP